jgi:hypothetical protein
VLTKEIDINNRKVLLNKKKETGYDGMGKTIHGRMY